MVRLWILSYLAYDRKTQKKTFGSRPKNTSGEDRTHANKVDQSWPELESKFSSKIPKFSSTPCVATFLLTDPCLAGSNTIACFRRMLRRMLKTHVRRCAECESTACIIFAQPKRATDVRACRHWPPDRINLEPARIITMYSWGLLDKSFTFYELRYFCRVTVVG